MRERFNYPKTQEYVKLLNQLKKHQKLWDGMTRDAQEQVIGRINDCELRMNKLIAIQKSELRAAKRREKKMRRDRQPLTLTRAMIDLSKDQIDRPVYEGLVQPKPQNIVKRS